MKKLLVSLLVVAGTVSTAQAANEFRYTTNNAGGYMFFTYSPCVYVDTGVRIPNKFYVYSTSSTGVKVSDGCYSHNDPFYFITWNGGGTTNINVNSTRYIPH